MTIPSPPTGQRNAPQAEVPSYRTSALKVGWQFRSANDLIMIKGARGYSWLHWNDTSKQMMSYTIKHYASQLPGNNFIRVHQNCLVNRQFIQKIQLTHRGPLLRLTTGEEIIVARRRWTAVKKELLKYCVAIDE